MPTTARRARSPTSPPQPADRLLQQARGRERLLALALGRRLQLDEDRAVVHVAGPVEVEAGTARDERRLPGRLRREIPFRKPEGQPLRELIGKDWRYGATERIFPEEARRVGARYDDAHRRRFEREQRPVRLHRTRMVDRLSRAEVVRSLLSQSAESSSTCLVLRLRRLPPGGIMLLTSEDR